MTNLDLQSFKSQLSSMTFILSSQNIDQSLSAININYTSLQLLVSSLQVYYDSTIQPIVDFNNQYSLQLNNTLTLTQNYSANWNDFETLVLSNSSKWLRPFTIFYPTLIQDNITQNDINTITTWLGQYFPVTNTDGSLNYVQNQNLLVNCYLYTYDTDNKIKLNDYAFSYAKCSTHNATIHAHCQTLITGGWIHCNQGAYLCDTTLDCYPSLKVDCWYGDPYLFDIPNYGKNIPSNNPPAKTNKNYSSYVNSRVNVRGQILADITMNFLDKKETGIQTLKFIVDNCNWAYVGNI